MRRGKGRARDRLLMQIEIQIYNTLAIPVSAESL